MAVSLMNASTAAFPWIYPVEGNNATTFIDGDRVIASWGAQAGNVSYMALNCGKLSAFTPADTVDSAIQIWTNLGTSLTYDVKSIGSYGDSQYCRFCTSKSGGECSIPFHVEPKAAGHAATTWFVGGNAPVGTEIPGAASAPGSSSSGNGTSAAPNSTTVAPPSSPPTSTTAPPAATSSKASGATAVKVSGFAMGALAVIAFVAL